MIVERIPNFSTTPSVDYRASIPSYLLDSGTVYCVKPKATCNRYVLSNGGQIAIYNSPGGAVCTDRRGFTWTVGPQKYDVDAVPDMPMQFRCVISVFQDANLKFRFRVKFNQNIGQFDLDEPGYTDGPNRLPIFEKMATVDRPMKTAEWRFQCPLVLSFASEKNFITGISIVWTGFSAQPEVSITVWRKARAFSENLVFFDMTEFPLDDLITDDPLGIAMMDDNPLLNWSSLYSLTTVVDNGQHGNSEMDGVWNTVMSVFATQSAETVLGRIDNLGGSLVAR